MLISEALGLIKESLKLQDQRDLARLLNVSQGTISNYLKNKSYPTLLIAARIYGEYGYAVEPFTELALKKEWDYIKGSL